MDEAVDRNIALPTLDMEQEGYSAMKPATNIRELNCSSEGRAARGRRRPISGHPEAQERG